MWGRCVVSHAVTCGRRVRRLLTFQVATFKTEGMTDDMPHPNRHAALTREALHDLLAQHLPGATLDMRDDTHKHLEHNVEVDHHGAHFFVKIIWPGFASMPRLARHKHIMQLLSAAWEARQLHSLSLRLMTPEEAFTHNPA